MAEFLIDCSDELMAKIEAIAFSETKIEVGGFLVGTYDENGAKVTEVLPARHSVGQSTQLTFTHETWNALYADLKEIDGALVGWFHSHPNFGVFLSEHDQFIQQNFFGANGNITIVVDPIRGRRGWFYSQDGKIKKYQKEEDTTRARLGVSATNSDENIEAIMGTSNNGVSTSKVVIISAIMSLIGTFLGYGLSTATGGNSTSQADVVALSQRVQFLEAQLGLIGVSVPSPKPTPAKVSPKASSKASSSGTKKSGSKAGETPTVTSGKTTGKTSGKTSTKTSNSETRTAQTLQELVVAVEGQPCKTDTLDKNNKFVCKLSDGGVQPKYIWVKK